MRITAPLRQARSRARQVLTGTKHRQPSAIGGFEIQGTASRTFHFYARYAHASPGIAQCFGIDTRASLLGENSRKRQRHRASHQRLDVHAPQPLGALEGGHFDAVENDLGATA